MIEKKFVLMLNDYPIGVYNSQASADEAAKDHKKLFFAHSYANAPKYYRTYEFVVEAPATL